MCGFVGGLCRSPVDRSRVRRALNSLVHRGPDGMGEWYSPDGSWFLGHARLSIIGLNNGQQPIASADGQTQLVVNGEFYGYQAIRSRLRAEGFHFATESDSEILLHLYERYGINAAQQLRGEFAAVIADRRNNAMIAIRDRFGIKPLFYTVHNGDVLFASEIKALLALGAPAAWDGESVTQEAFMTRPQERTLFAGIYTVPSGCYAIAQKGAVRIYPYWDWDFPMAEALAADRRSEQEVVAGFARVLDDAVRERLIADVEVASYLSGGIDSCAVLGLAQRHMSRPIRAFTLAFEDILYDESQLAEQQATFVGANFQRIPIKSRNLAEVYGDTVWHAETVLVNGHASAKYLLSRAVRDAGIKVVFTGEGSDELLGGYAPFRRDALLHHGGGRNAEATKALMQQMYDSNAATRALFINESPPPPESIAVERRLGWRPSWMDVFSHPGKANQGLFRSDFAAGPGGINPYALPLDRLPLAARVFGRDRLHQALYLNSKFQLPNFILTFLGDRMEMAHSVEGRVPFLDHHVAEYAANIPIDMKIRGIREKYVLREATKDCLIEAVYNREKHPFTAPPAQREDDPMMEFFTDTLNSKALDDQPIYDPVKARSLLDAWRSAPQDQRIKVEGIMHRVVSTTVLHQRFGMSADVS